MLKSEQDAYGHLMLDYLKHGRGRDFVERDDGLLDLDPDPAYLFAEFRGWSMHERKAMRFVRGRVLDAGCGAGRVALYLQKNGFDVLGIDVSPLAVRVCKLRGLKNARVLPVAEASRAIGKFDTILMFGNNFGLCSSYKRGRLLLKRFHAITAEGARIIAESLDPYATKDPIHLAYHRRNRRRGRMSGQVRLRIRYRNYMTPWFDYLLVCQREMRRMVAGTGWHVEHFIRSKGPQYIAIIRRISQ